MTIRIDDAIDVLNGFRRAYINYLSQSQMDTLHLAIATLKQIKLWRNGEVVDLRHLPGEKQD
jgi:hypothetical protein